MGSISHLSKFISSGEILTDKLRPFLLGKKRREKTEKHKDPGQKV